LKIFEKKMIIGSDFEVPIYDHRRGIYVSAIGLIGGTKKRPLSIGNGCFRQEDNVSAEFNIPPVNNVKDFKKFISYCLEQGEAIIQKINTDYRFDITSSARYPMGELGDMKAWEFGCEPAICAYDKSIVISSETEDTLRTFGFHIHINADQNPYELVKKLDYFLGLPSLTMDPDDERRRLYGKAGECRVKEYGVEYRVLGSYMLNFQDFVWEKIEEAIKSKLKIKDAVREKINSSIRVTA